MSIYHVLGSGSDANSYVFGDGEDFYLVDAGFSCKQLCIRLGEVGIAPEQIRAIFLTHTHGDHFRGVSVFSRKFQVPVIGHKSLYYDRSKVYQSVDISHNKDLIIKNCKFHAFKTYHDSEGSSGYFFDLNGFNLSVITDTGYYCQKMLEIASKSNVVFLESNYDEQMLANGDYPQDLKRRIASKHGHLSNNQACDFLTELAVLMGKNENEAIQIADSSTIDVYLCHLSLNNNTLQRVESGLKLLKCDNFNITVCPRGEIVIGKQAERGLINGSII
ncbi:MAG: MBL fold metallo-hydrolase [Spirochaetales bacterium]|nr:MBL fold metallo-hydrolase [Spirochaetales bacterium]